MVDDTQSYETVAVDWTRGTNTNEKMDNIRFAMFRFYLPDRDFCTSPNIHAFLFICAQVHPISIALALVTLGLSFCSFFLISLTILLGYA